MKKQVLVLHGGESFATEEDYLTYLRNKDWDLDRLRRRPDWKHYLPEALGTDYEVFYPRFPAHNARYEEWKLIFFGVLKKLQPGVSIVAHSLGGTFLAKFLIEEELPVPLGKVFMVAATFSSTQYEGSDPNLVDFYWSGHTEVIKEKVEAVHFFHAPDDPVVPYADFLEWQKHLTGDRVYFHELPAGYLHVNGTEFPELIAELK